MRKSTLFVSAAVTAFMIAVLIGVVSAYQNIISAAAQPTAFAEVAQVVVPVPTQEATPTQEPTPPAITAEQAADLASKELGKTDLYSVEFTQFESIDAFLVTFSSGDLVYVGLDGQILSISKLPVTVVTLPKKGNGEGNGGGNNNQNNDHDDDDDDDDDDGGGDDD
jgi:hypothetical protein